MADSRLDWRAAQGLQDHAGKSSSGSDGEAAFHRQIQLRHLLHFAAFASFADKSFSILGKSIPRNGQHRFVWRTIAALPLLNGQIHDPN